jgi:hypothetical protein
MAEPWQHFALSRLQSSSCLGQRRISLLCGLMYSLPLQERLRGSKAPRFLRVYSKRIRTISGWLPTRIGGPQVPAPLEV